MEKLILVSWDRFIVDEELGYLCVFGWIDRAKDAYKDFVVLGYNDSGLLWWQTSSAERSAEIGTILGAPHMECQRAENNFNLSNVIKLKR